VQHRGVWRGGVVAASVVRLVGGDSWRRAADVNEADVLASTLAAREMDGCAPHIDIPAVRILLSPAIKP
jgi:hypothetical protein